MAFVLPLIVTALLVSWTVSCAGTRHGHGGADASARSAASAAASLSDLPLEVVSPDSPEADALSPAAGDSARELAILLSGDGGWAEIDREISDSLAHHGIPVVALDSRQYLASKRTPERVTSDVARIARVYGSRFGKSAVVLIGYSRGADILPFVVNRLPNDIRSELELIALLGLAPNANFKFHMIDLVSNHHRSDDLPTIPEVSRLHGERILCFYGMAEKEAACKSLPDSVAVAIAMPGGHHFGKRYGEIASRILAALGAHFTSARP